MTMQELPHRGLSPGVGKRILLLGAFFSLALCASVSRAASAGAVVAIPNPPPVCAPVPSGVVAWWPANGTPNDTIGSNHGALLNGVHYATGNAGQGFAFPGHSNNAVRIPASPTLDVGAGPGLTIEAWINPADLSVRSPLVEWNRGGPGLVTWGIHLYILRPDEFDLGAGNLNANLTDVDGNWHMIMAPGGTVQANTWQHVALTYDRNSGVARLYRNGQVVGEENLGSFAPQTSYDLYLGNRPAGDGMVGYQGLMDEPAIYNRALSGEEITLIFTAGTAGKCSPGTNPPVELTFDMSEGFSRTSNPAAPWSYGYLETLAGPFTVLGFQKDFQTLNGVAVSGWQVTDSLAPGVYRLMGNSTGISAGGAFTAEPGTMWAFAGNTGTPRNFGVIRFTVPEGRAGSYRIETAVRSVYDGDLSADGEFRVGHNGLELFGEFIPANSGTAYTNAIVLAAGDTVDFAVGRGASGLVERSGLKIAAALVSITNAPPSNSLPSIVSQPASQTVIVGGTATFSVSAAGPAPLSYQWRFNGQNLPGRTSPSLILSNAQPAMAGSFSAVVANPFGAVTSAVATLTFISNPTNPPLACAPVPTGLVSWWTGDGVGTDFVGTNHATLVNGVSFVTGLVGQAWRFDGVNDYARARASGTLNVGAGPGFTIEGWINPSDLSHLRPIAEWNNGLGAIGALLWTGVDTAVPGDGERNLMANLVDTSGVSHYVWTAKGLISTGSWQHVAVSYDKASGLAVLYHNGTLVAQASLGDFTPQTTGDLYFGYRPSGPFSGLYWAGGQDEMSLYSRALAAGEIQAIASLGAGGKCRSNTTLTNAAPEIVSQPASQNVTAGATVSFTVGVSGTPPFSYQWRLNGEALAGGTGSALMLPNVQASQSGPYSVVVVNGFGSVTSEVAMLTVNLAPPAAVVRGPYLQAPTVSNLVVRWRTDLPTDSRVRFGLAANDLAWEAVDPGVTTEHSVTLNGLAPDTKYFYAVGSITDIQAGGPGYFFTTPPAGPKPTRIWAIGDAGTASFGSTAPLAVRDAYAEYTAARPTDVWLMLGDNAYFSGTDPEYQAAVFNVYQDFLRTTPVWSTLGNHETYAPGPGGQLAYFDIFTLPQDGRSGGLASGTERYYSFNYGDIHFVCLDSEISDKSATGPMLTWLEQDLAANTKEWLIAFWHSPPYSRGSHDSDFESNLVQMRQTVVPVLESYGVDLVLSGHSHSYERSFLLNGHYGSSGSLESSMIQDGGTGRPEETGAYSKSATQGAVYVVAGSSGQTSGGQLNHPAMFASLNQLGSMVIDVETNRMEVKFLRETGDVDDQFTIIKGPASPTMPTIVSEPASQTVPIGGTASFSVGVTGTAPFSYQWRLNGDALAGQTGSTLVLANVEASQAGPYSVVVTNAAGTATSSDAILTVVPILPCQPVPAGLVSWWTGDGVGTDLVGTNHATLLNGLSFVPGLVGPAWHFDGVNDYGHAAPSPTLNVGAGAGLTIEGWIKPANVAQLHPLVEWNNGSIGTHFWMSVDTQATGDGVGNLLANLVDTAGVPHAVRTPAHLVTTSTWQHVALTYDKASGQAVIYLNGAAVGQANLGTFTPQTSHPLYFGYRPSGAISGIRYSGDMDEITLYNRSLPASEIQALHASGLQGKCKGEIQPSIVSGPASQTVIAGGTASFTVVASGSTPLEYQWLHGGEPIPEATNSTLTLSNVQIAQAGNYSVVVANSEGSVTSADAVLTVNLPPPTVRVVDTIGVPGGGAVVPIQLLAQGNENALGFSLNFNPALLSFSGAVLGEDAPDGATLIVNNQQAGEGKVGLAVALPASATFSPGTQQVVMVSFTVAPVITTTTTPVTFGDVPTVRQVSDAQAQVLGAVFTSGSVSITEADFEGDVASRPNGNRALTITDWVQAGRFVAGLDTIANPGEFQRADSAPRGDRGNGVISITDWVQAGRYSVGLDPLTPVGGPTEPTSGNGGGEGGFQPASGRTLSILNTSIPEGLTNVVLVTLDCSGNENALGFTVNFDAAKLHFVSVDPGAGTGTATLNINATQAGVGRIGVALAQAPGITFQAGIREVAKLQFAAIAEAPETSLITFGDAPIYRETSDSQANSLTTAYAAGTVTITTAGPPLTFNRSGNTLIVSWSAGAVGFKLESTTDLDGIWTEVTGVIPFGDQQIAAVPLDGLTKFFRLRKP